MRVLVFCLIFARGLAAGHSLRVQQPLAASDGSLPEPDLAVVDADDHRVDHPSVAHLVIEVSGTSLRRDREIKAKLYAETNIPEYWIVNLVDAVIEVHREPENGRYTFMKTYRKGETLAGLGIDVAVDAIIA